MLRIATFNIKHGAQADGRVDHPALIRTCADLDADLLGLQEVDSGRLRSSFRNQAALVARRLGYEIVYGTVVRHGVMGRYGNALLAAAPSATSSAWSSCARAHANAVERSSPECDSRPQSSAWPSRIFSTNRRG